MNDLSVYLAVHDYSSVTQNGVLLTRLQKRFDVLPIASFLDLQRVLTVRALFCLLIHGHVHEESNLDDVRKLCLAAQRTPCLFYGEVANRELAFQLSHAGVNHFVESRNFDFLVEKLRVLKDRVTFRIDLEALGIELEQCSYWSRRFLRFISQNFNFIKYRSVAGIARQLDTSEQSLRQALRTDGLCSPKQYLICLRNFYAAYLLSTHPELRTIHVAQRCGFSSEADLYRSFSKTTGSSVRVFRHKDWQEYPGLFLKNHEERFGVFCRK